MVVNGGKSSIGISGGRHQSLSATHSASALLLLRQKMCQKKLESLMDCFE